MELIASFSVDHTKIVPGIFVSREDNVGGSMVTTYDIRVTRPNREPAIDVAAMHTLEHIIATFLRNDPNWKDEIIYWGPMGCLTGFYLILKGNRSPKDIYGLILRAFKSVKGAESVPGATYNWVRVTKEVGEAASPAATAFDPDAMPTTSTAGTLNQIKYYTATADVPAQAGNGVLTPIGDCMFVCPDAQYEVTVNYSYSRIIDGAHVTPDTDHKTITVDFDGTGTSTAKFKAGKTYAIIFKLYKNASIGFSTETDTTELDEMEEDDDYDPIIREAE